MTMLFKSFSIWPYFLFIPFSHAGTHTPQNVTPFHQNKGDDSLMKCSQSGRKTELPKDVHGLCMMGRSGSPVISCSMDGDRVDLCKSGRGEWKVGRSCGEDL